MLVMACAVGEGVWCILMTKFTWTPWLTAKELGWVRPKLKIDQKMSCKAVLAVPDVTLTALKQIDTADNIT